MSIYLLGNSGLKINNLFGFLFKKRGPYYKQSSTKNENVRKESDAAYNARKKAEQDEIDAILDKVKHKGYESLSAHEKQKLFDRSNNG